MAQINTGFFNAMAALPQGENILPRFRDPRHDVNVCTTDDVPKRYTRLMGLDCGRRILPYTQLDRYDRHRTQTEVPSIIMKNDKLQATFLPTLGGRLISLVDLSDNRELLYCNTQLQVANLAIRNAWFAGGIEWNIGQYGHAFSTCSKVFASVQTSPDGEEFLRLYDYERCKRLWWHIDFHLPEGSPLLYAHVEIHHIDDDRTTLYYWTNTAVEMTDHTRIFASNEHAIYLDPFAPPVARRYGDMKMPTIELYPDIDASYPKQFQCSQEYFFTCDSDDLPWEASFEQDGRGFFEASTHPLSYRKMFCWGDHAGGRRWQRFLAPDLGKEYVEIQSGLAASQLHGLYLDGKKSVRWTQAFGPITGDTEKLHQKDYHEAWIAATQDIRSLISLEKLQAQNEKFIEAAQIPPHTILQQGDGWGFIEKKANGIALPPAFSFEPETMTVTEAPWNYFLDQGRLPSTDDIDTAFTYPSVVGQTWIHALEHAIEDSRSSFETAVLRHYLGIALLEDEQIVAAKQCWLDTFSVIPNAWTARNLAALELRWNAPEFALRWYRKAFSLIPAQNRYLPMCEEFFKLLVDQGRDDEALEFFDSLPPDAVASSDSLALDRARLAAVLKDPQTIKALVFDRELSNIREGDVPLNALWDQYCLLTYHELRPLPEHLTFNQY